MYFVPKQIVKYVPPVFHGYFFFIHEVILRYYDPLI